MIHVSTKSARLSTAMLNMIVRCRSFPVMLDMGTGVGLLHKTIPFVASRLEPHHIFPSTGVQVDVLNSGGSKDKRKAHIAE